MFATKFVSRSYKYFLKPILFLFDPEWVHDLFTGTGKLLESQDWLVGGLFRYSNPGLHKQVLGLDFANPIGLAAGFDYDGHLARVMYSVSFGFNTVGTVTALPYAGNPRPRLSRLPRSKSLLVNKGFKSSGAMIIRQRLDQKKLNGRTIGISVGSSNIEEINTLTKAIDDYIFTFKLFRSRKYVKYFELNVSCPNILLKGAFTDPNNFAKLCFAIKKLKISKPIFVKMPNEINYKDSDTLVQIAIDHGIHGFIFSNLVKDRNNPALDRREIETISHLSGNFSGKPTILNSNRLIAHTREKFGSDIAIIGCGGIFSPEDAKAKLDAGADLVQLITGMIFEGPQIVGEINRELANC